MGTSGAYGGSGGTWNQVQDGVAAWLDSLPGQPEDTGTDDDANNDAGTGVPPSEPSEPDQAVLDSLRPVASALGWGRRPGGRGDGPSGGTVTGAMPRSASGGSPGGGGRSRARAASVGGRLASGVAALRRGDASELAALGLDLDELGGLDDPYEQARRLMEAATAGGAQTIEEDELRLAAVRTAIWALQDGDHSPAIDDVIRYFVTEYVYQVILTEIGAVLRSGERDGTAAIPAEDRIHETIVALARTVTIQTNRLGHADLTAITDGVLEETRSVFGSRA